MQQLQLLSFALAMATLVVCGWVFTRKPRKKLPTQTVRPATPANVNPAASLSKKKRAVIGRAAAYRSLKKLGRPCDRLLTREPRRVSHHFLPGGRYAFAALPALSAIPLNSAAVQALTVLTCEIEPAPDAAINAAITASPSLASEMSRRHNATFFC